MINREITFRHGGQFAGGAIFLVGIGALWMGVGYDMGTMMRVGAGAFPVTVAVLLIACGLIVILESFRADPGAVSLPLGSVRSGLGVLGAIASFALTIEPFGQIPAVALCAFFVSLAVPVINWRHTLALVLILPPVSWVIFVLGLGLQIRSFG